MALEGGRPDAALAVLSLHDQWDAASWHRLGPVRNKPCPCGSKYKLKDCCGRMLDAKEKGAKA